MAANIAMAQRTKTTKPITTVIPATSLDAQQMADQAMARNYAEQMVSKTPAEQEATQIALTKEQQAPAPASDARAGTVGSAPGATVQQPGTQATTETASAATPAPTVEDNPYKTQLEQMKFEYNPQTDTQYLQDAAGLENQVVQMMTGRGGLYSSVAQSALQSRLVALQNDFRTQKYAQFVQDRNFLFDMSKQWFSEQSTKWNQQQTEKEFAFAQAKEAFDQQMALAQYNLQVQAQQFSQAQARSSARAASTQAQYDQQFDVAAKNLSSEQTTIQRNAFNYYREAELYKTYLDRWKKTGTADSYVAKYFGVSMGSSLSRSTSAITSKAAYLDSYKGTIKGLANDYNMSADLLDQIKLFQQNKYVPGTAPVQYTPLAQSPKTITQQTR
jgi:hypothetical protein